MIWMWYVGPALVALIYLLTGWRDRRRDAEIERWRVTMGPRGKATKRVPAPPSNLLRMSFLAGGGQSVAHFELQPKLAYLSVMAANATNASDHLTVSGKLDVPSYAADKTEPGYRDAGTEARITYKLPSFTVRPLPIVEGNRIANTGIEFKKDPEFMALFLVEPFVEGGPQNTGTEQEIAKAIRRWLSPPIRAALLELPDVWLRIEGRAMGVTVYGPADADKINELVICADVIFAEHGAEGGPSLLGDDEEDEPEEKAPAPPPKKAKKPAEKKASAKA